jgi:dihydroxyacetone kinase
MQVRPLVSYLLNQADTFVPDMIAGLVAAHSELVAAVPGGVVRTTPTPAGEVAVVIGGGSGHYPAFAGLVGEGLAHGAAMGHVFASPSANQIRQVATAAASDSGVLLSYGNYAGDVLNFNQAQEQLRLRGIPTRTVVVTDDIASAPRAERGKRRGLAGDLMVFRAAGWGAGQGRSLDEVWAVAARANDRTRTLGVAFSGCALPGAQEPLFTVPAGRMAIGMGIHGEHGIDECALPTAAELAHLLVERLLAERPDDDGGDLTRVAVILNGLGSVKAEELYITYKGVAEELAAAGLTVIAPEVGEFATSFEMAGVSLTITWLDDELEQAWISPATAVGYRRGAQSFAAIGRGEERAPAAHPRSAEQAAPTQLPVSAESARTAVLLLDVLVAIEATIDVHVQELGRLDSLAGDGDHGIGMQRGAHAAVRAAELTVTAGGGPALTLKNAAESWADDSGGTSGALWGVGLAALADHLVEDPVTPAAVAAGVSAAAQAVGSAGGARLGDKTLLDALIPFSERLTELVSTGESLSGAWQDAAERATAAAAATSDLIPKIGRARTHAGQGIGGPDPGAVSLALAVTAAAQILHAKKGNGS